MSATMEPRMLADEQPIIEKTDGASAAVGETPVSLFIYLLLGTAFGIVLTKSEAVSWFRIQEMFRFRSFHMYGIMGTAVLVGALSLRVIRRRGMRSANGQPIVVPPKAATPFLERYWMGGTVFGLGWGLLGACPGPIFALVGSGLTIMIIGLLSALAGTMAYGWLAHRLPH